MLCAVLEIQRSSYYAWQKRPRYVDHLPLQRQAKVIHRRSRGAAGSRTIAKTLGVSRWRARKLMRDCQLVSTQPSKPKFRLAQAEAEAVPAANVEPLRLSDVAREAAAGQEARLTAKGGALRLDPSLDGIEIETNGTLLALALRNLVENAVNHSPPGGTVRLSWTGNAIAVEDEGPGMLENEIARATSRFFRGSNRTSIGSGLGLAIVEICAEKLGGRLILGRRKPAGLRAELQLAGHRGGYRSSSPEEGSTGKEHGDAVG